MKHKWIFFIISTLLAVGGVYAAFIYVYTDAKFAPAPLLLAPSQADVHSAWKATHSGLFIHRVNTPERARKKSKKYNGLELDIFPQADGTLIVAHDEKQAQNKTSLQTIFKAAQNGPHKTWWLDIKGELSNAQIDEILQIAQACNISPENLLFEVNPGPTAKRIRAKQLGLLLPLPEGFEQDDNDPARREALNQAALTLWEEYQPTAVSASFGKYPVLKAYFPQMPKAIYYSNTVRPSLKKTFMARQMQKDPSVKIFMLDEYNWINL